MKVFGVEIVIDKSLLPNIFKMKSSIDEVVMNTNGKEVIEGEIV